MTENQKKTIKEKIEETTGETIEDMGLQEEVEERGWDYEPEDNQAQKILKDLEKWLTKNYGKRCSTRASGCPVCQVWAVYDLLKLFLK